MTEAMPFLQKTILLSYDPRSFFQGPFLFLSPAEQARYSLRRASIGFRFAARFAGM